MIETVQRPLDKGEGWGEKWSSIVEHNKKFDRFRRNEFPNNHFLLDRCLKIVSTYERSRSDFQSRVYREFNLLEIQIIITGIHISLNTQIYAFELYIKYFVLIAYELSINNINYPTPAYRASIHHRSCKFSPCLEGFFHSGAA